MSIILSIDYILEFLLFIKLLYIIAYLGHWLSDYSFWYYWKTKTEFVFNMGASILLMYFFNPFVPPKSLNKDTRQLFCLFGLFMFLDLLNIKS